MLLERKHSNLIITDFSEEDLDVLIDLCSVKYRERDSTGEYHVRNIDNYQLVSEDVFLTSMSFLHGIKSEFPDAKVNLPERDKVSLLLIKKFKLFSDQEHLLNEFIDQGKRATVSAVTGSGKTVLALAAIFYTRFPTLITCPTQEIQRQWKKELINKLCIPQEQIGLFDGEHKQIRPFTIAIYNSAYIHIQELLGKFELFIPDETHRIGAKQFSKIALNIDTLYNLAISAKPKRQDGNDELIYKTMGNLIKGPNFTKLVSINRIAPIDHKRIFVELLEDERRRYEEYRLKSFSAPKKKYNENTKTQAWYRTRAEEIAHGSLAKIPVATRLVFQHQKEKILIFNKFITQANMMQTILKPFNAQLLIGETKKDERKAIFSWFHQSKSAVLISTKVLDEGVDVPDAKVGIIMSGFGTELQMIQRTGRTVRYLPDKTALIYEIVSKRTVDERQSDRRQLKED